MRKSYASLPLPLRLVIDVIDAAATFDVGHLEIGSVDTVPSAFVQLFENTFKADFPDFPVHYVAHYDRAPVGYYHISRSDDYALIGGLCVADDYRRFGIASALVHAAHRDAGQITGFFGYCGSAASYKLLTDAGYRDTTYPYLIVHWTCPATLAEQQEIIDAVAALGPF